jgi:hypothetical protein
MIHWHWLIVAALGGAATLILAIEIEIAYEDGKWPFTRIPGFCRGCGRAGIIRSGWVKMIGTGFTLRVCRKCAAAWIAEGAVRDVRRAR